MTLKVKYLILPFQLLLVLLLLLKIKYLASVIQSKKKQKKLTITQKKITNYNHDKFITTPEFNNFMLEIFDLRLKLADISGKSDIANFPKKTDFDNQLRKCYII